MNQTPDHAKIAFVTGAGSGIGRATAIRFAQTGARVALVGRSMSSLRATADAIESTGGVALPLSADVSNEADVQTAVRATVERFGPIDVAANCAALAPGGAVHEITAEVFDRTIATNLRGTWLAVKYEAEAMVRAGGGAIVNVSSISAAGGGPSDYSASKAGVEGLTRGAAEELAQFGIRVNALRAGLFDTPMLHEAWETGDDPDTVLASAAEVSMLKRIGDPAEAAEAIVWLCSSAASFVTGSCMTVDGGILGRWI